APSGVGGGTVTTGGCGVTVAGYQAAGTLRQLLFDFNHTRELVREEVALERVAAANLTRVESDLVLQVKQAFYTDVQDEGLVIVNEKQCPRPAGSSRPGAGAAQVRSWLAVRRGPRRNSGRRCDPEPH